MLIQTKLIVFIMAFSTSTDMFELMATQKSFYIPLLPKDLLMDGQSMVNEEGIRTFFEDKLNCGEVSHVDFITKPTKVDSQSVAVFVHFKDWTMNGSTRYIMSLFMDGECTMKGYHNMDTNRFVPFVSSYNNRPRFFKMKVNRSPIPTVVDVPTNIHQILHDNTIMREIISNQTQRIAELEEEVRRLTSTNQSSVYEPNTSKMEISELM